MRRVCRGEWQLQHWANDPLRTLNAERRTPNGTVTRERLRSVFGVRGWMFDV
jgi:hypothetical protein